MQTTTFRNILFILVFILSVFGSTDAKVYNLKKAESEVSHRHKDANLGVSDRNLLDLDYSGKYGLPRQALSANETTVLKILAIKVNFKGRSRTTHLPPETAISICAPRNSLRQTKAI
jgi:hypothetical protein